MTNVINNNGVISDWKEIVVEGNCLMNAFDSAMHEINRDSLSNGCTVHPITILFSQSMGLYEFGGSTKDIELFYGSNRRRCRT